MFLFHSFRTESADFLTDEIHWDYCTNSASNPCLFTLPPLGGLQLTINYKVKATSLNQSSLYNPRWPLIKRSSNPTPIIVCPHHLATPNPNPEDIAKWNFWERAHELFFFVRGIAHSYGSTPFFPINHNNFFVLNCTAWSTAYSFKGTAWSTALHALNCTTWSIKLLGQLHWLFKLRWEEKALGHDLGRFAEQNTQRWGAGSREINVRIGRVVWEDNYGGGGRRPITKTRNC